MIPNCFGRPTVVRETDIAQAVYRSDEIISMQSIQTSPFKCSNSSDVMKIVDRGQNKKM